MFKTIRSPRVAYFVLVLLLAASMKLFYSTAGVNELRWVLAPTTFLVEIVTGESFSFESHAGYMNEDNSFLIADSCSGVNFLIMAFLMLSFLRIWDNRSESIKWIFIPAVVVIAYLTTIAANTVRISTALELHRMNADAIWINPEQVHRFQGIFIYFGFLLLLYVLYEKMSSRYSFDRTNSSWLIRRPFLPLLVYWMVTLGIPLANGAYREGTDFREHSIFVLLTPLILVLPFAAFRLVKNRRPAFRRD